MRSAPMRFNAVSMRHNPEKLSISGKNRLHEYLSPCCEADSVSIGKELRRITGEGILCGEDCLEQYKTLEGFRNRQTAAKLVLAGMQPMYACLRELSMTAKPEDNVLHYHFEFAEMQSPRRSSRRESYYLTMTEGESLWDIAYLFGTSVEQLTALNPHIPMIDEIREGERIRIC